MREKGDEGTSKQALVMLKDLPPGSSPTLPAASDSWQAASSTGGLLQNIPALARPPYGQPCGAANDPANRRKPILRTLGQYSNRFCIPTPTLGNMQFLNH